jgi:drug/metabolite transporter (DMT)-like permease
MWPVYSLGNAFFESVSDALSKRIADTHNLLIAAFLTRAVVFLFLLLVWLSIDSTVYFSLNLLWAILVSGILNSWAFVLYMRALRESELSVALPLLKFGPVWNLFTGYLINGDEVSALSGIGVIVMVMGSYIGNFHFKQAGIFSPLVFLLKSRGTRSMIFVSFLWSICAPFDKEGIRSSSPLYYLCVLNLTLLFGLMPLVVKHCREGAVFPRLDRYYLGVGITGVLSSICQMHAFALAPVALATAMKRLSALFGLIWGKLFFGEANLFSKGIGALITLLGMLLVLLGGVSHGMQ